jgi:chromosome segregation ATPase
MVLETMRPYFALVCLLAMALALASCGGSSSSDPPTTSAATETDAATEESSAPSQSRAEFITQADGICQKVKEEDAPVETRFTQLNETAKTPQEGKEAADLLRQLTDYVSGGVAKLRELEPPPGDEEAIDSYISAVEERVATEEKMADAIETRNENRFKALSEEFSAASSLAKEEAERYGFKVCGIG